MVDTLRRWLGYELVLLGWRLMPQGAEKTDIAAALDAVMSRHSHTPEGP